MSAASWGGGGGGVKYFFRGRNVHQDLGYAEGMSALNRIESEGQLGAAKRMQKVKTGRKKIAEKAFVQLMRALLTPLK